MANLQELKRVKNAVLYTDGTTKCIMLQNVRVSFPKIAVPEPETDDDGNPRIDKKTGKQKKSFSLAAMLPKETHGAAKDLCREIIAELIADKKDQQGKPVKIAADKKFIINGDDAAREEYMDHFIVTAREARQPAVRNRRGDLVLDTDEIAEMLFAGCIANVMIRPWFFSGTVKETGKTYPKRVSAGLVGVQFVKDDGTRFGTGSINTDGAWDNLAEDDDDDGMGSGRPSAPNDDDDDDL